MTTPTTAIDAETMEAAAAVLYSLENAYDRQMAVGMMDERDIQTIARALQEANAKAKHFEDHFQKLARIYGPANAALDTARREWAKRERV